MALRLLPIARPCHERFDAMHGDEKRRFCDSCEKHVHDLSAGTEEEARELLAANQGNRICVRFTHEASGTVRFRAAATVAAVAAAVAVSGCSSQVAETPVQDPSSVMMMGDMVPDAVDRCPDPPTPESIADGCPDPNATPSTPPDGDAGKR